MLEYGVPYYEIVIKGMQYPNTIILFVENIISNWNKDEYYSKFHIFDK